MRVDALLLDQIRDHAKECYPKECCGLVIEVDDKQQYFKCGNDAQENNHFILNPEDYAKAEETGKVIAVMHSHCDESPWPSQADKVSCEHSGVPWLIMNWPVGHFFYFEPMGYMAALIGREFHHGVLDCYTLIRDYYERELNITIPDYDRNFEWWLKGDDLYRDNFRDAGFLPVDDMQKHDVILMSLRSKVPNHAAIYIGENIILQHCTNRLSGRDVYGGWWKKCTSQILRHKDLL